MSVHLENIKSEIDELVSQGQEVKVEIEDYLDEAVAIDEAYERRNEHQKYIPLDDLPYGEEILRTQNLPVQIEEVIEALSNLDLEKDSVTAVVEVIEEARRVIEDAKSTVDDCTDLPPSEGN